MFSFHLFFAVRNQSITPDLHDFFYVTAEILLAAKSEPLEKKHKSEHLSPRAHPCARMRHRKCVSHVLTHSWRMLYRVWGNNHMGGYAANEPKNLRGRVKRILIGVAEIMPSVAISHWQSN